nr:hypothetical protein [Tanacetum cinerariifolium]
TAKTPTETKSKDKGKGIMVEEPKPMKKKQHVEMDEEVMFGRPYGQDQVWKSQRSVHGQAKIPLARFTLDQMLNAVRLRVEEQSEMSLEVLRFTRQQLQKGQHE